MTWDPIAARFADNPFFEREVTDTSWWRRPGAAAWLIAALMYLGLLLVWLARSSRSIPLERGAEGLAGLTPMMLALYVVVGVPRSASSILAREQAHGTGTQLILTPYPRGAWVVGALAGRLREALYALLLCLPAWLLLITGTWDVSGSCGLLLSPGLDPGPAGRICTAAAAWLQLLVTFFFGAALGAWTAVRIPHPALAGMVAQAITFTWYAATRVAQAVVTCWLVDSASPTSAPGRQSAAIATAAAFVVLGASLLLQESLARQFLRRAVAGLEAS